MLDITILAVGALKASYWQAAAQEYLKRLKPYARIKLLEVAAAPFTESTRDKSRQIEGERLAHHLAKRSEAAVFLLEEAGEKLDTLNLARRLEQNQRPLIFVIGGALGLDPELASQYPRLSLSPLTFTHEMARVLLLEQLYRAATIIRAWFPSTTGSTC